MIQGNNSQAVPSSIKLPGGFVKYSENASGGSIVAASGTNVGILYGYPCCCRRPVEYK